MSYPASPRKRRSSCSPSSRSFRLSQRQGFGRRASTCENIAAVDQKLGQFSFSSCHHLDRPHPPICCHHPPSSVPIPVETLIDIFRASTFPAMVRKIGCRARDLSPQPLPPSRLPHAQRGDPQDRLLSRSSQHRPATWTRSVRPGLHFVASLGGHSRRLAPPAARGRH